MHKFFVDYLLDITYILISNNVLAYDAKKGPAINASEGDWLT